MKMKLTNLKNLLKKDFAWSSKKIEKVLKFILDLSTIKIFLIQDKNTNYMGIEIKRYNFYSSCFAGFFAFALELSFMYGLNFQGCNS